MPTCYSTIGKVVVSLKKRVVDNKVSSAYSLDTYRKKKTKRTKEMTYAICLETSQKILIMGILDYVV